MIVAIPGEVRPNTHLEQSDLILDGQEPVIFVSEHTGWKAKYPGQTSKSEEFIGGV